MSEKKITYTTWGFKNELQYKLYINLFEIKKTLLKKPDQFQSGDSGFEMHEKYKPRSYFLGNVQVYTLQLCSMNPLHVFDKTVCQSLQIIYFEEDEY